MKVLITGGAGFIGSHLAGAMLAAGNDVTVLDDLSTGASENIAAFDGRAEFEFVHGSVRDVEATAPLVRQCDCVVHLAAAVGVQLIVDDPVHTLETNIHGSEVVLNLANKFGRKILIASTSEVYGKNTKVPFGEDDDTLLGSTRFTRWSYACSKMVDEFLALAYHDQYGLETIICRFFNTVGPRQTGKYGMVVPRFVQRALRGEPLEIYGDGRQSRCFCNVADVVGAICQLLDCPQAVGEVINVGTGESIDINSLAGKIVAMTGSTSEIRRLSYSEAYGRDFDDMMIRVPDLTKIQTLIGYAPKYSLEETLSQIIDHERKKITEG
ncbi:MAG: GDP-mannose 4,6-dehydratase [Phycisphaerae bacterium]|nr:GDP-mannose 4,6-dehydratase [Phycisphaerae bacterium]